MSEIKLTPKQEKFANLYVELGNASEAYRQAGYSYQNMSDEALWVEANKLLNHPKVSLKIKQLQGELKERHDITKDEAINELTNIVRVNPLDYIEISHDEEIELKEDGAISKSTKQVVLVKDLSQLTVEQQRCIKSISPVKGGIKVEFESKISAIDRLSKMLGWDEATKMDIDATLGVKPISKDVAKKMIDELE